jgi:hypothetical protein
MHIFHWIIGSAVITISNPGCASDQQGWIAGFLLKIAVLLCHGKTFRALSGPGWF